MARVVIPGFRKIEVSGGGEGGTNNYNDLTNKPSINNVPLVGNLKTVDLKLTDATLTEEGVPAEAKTVGTKLEEHSTSLLTLKKQLGKHTVKSDVPENAVFTDTVYDDEEVKGSISAQSTEMMDIKMLGWSVPRECPIQNEVNGNQFIQKVGRVDLGSLNWMYNTTTGHERFRTGDNDTPYIKPAQANNALAKAYSNIYVVNSANGTYSHVNDKSIAIDTSSIIWVYDTSYTDAITFKTAMQGQYLYYELANYNTITIDGNEIGETVSDVRKETTVNLLKPTLETTTQNGVTCTNNGDGTYTLIGTPTINTFFPVGVFTFKANVNYIMVGCPSGGEYSNKYAMYFDAYSDKFIDFGIGKSFTFTQDTKITISIVVRKDYAMSNVLFKPMLTTNLNTTYDDFVPYTGSTGQINSDVASLLKRIETLESLVNKTDTTTVETE